MKLAVINKGDVRKSEAPFGLYLPLSDIPREHQEALDSEVPESYDKDYTYLPYPSKLETLKELDFVRYVADNERNENLDFINLADKSVVKAFAFECSKEQIELSTEDIESLDRIIEESSAVILKLKYVYNRPRPAQVAKRSYKNFKPLNSKSAKTPSYPSGHAIQALLVAHYLGGIYSDKMRFLYDTAGKIAWSRVQGGYHFPSDIDYGRIIFKNIVSDLKTSIKLKSNECYMEKAFKNFNKDKVQPKVNEKMVCKSVTKQQDGTKEYSIKTRDRAWLPIDSLKIEKRDVGSGESRAEEHYITGIASSTSIDTYGTEMSLNALKSMSWQFSNGVPVLPRHNSNTSDGIGEWDEVIGRTSEAEIQRVQVKKAAVNEEAQYSLIVRSQIYSDNQKSKELMRRLSRGEPIGQSIGGWFEDVRVVENEDGEIQRVIVESVTLDHVAITRAPSNPDSNGLTMLSIRSSIDDFNSRSLGMDVKEEVREEKKEDGGYSVDEANQTPHGYDDIVEAEGERMEEKMATDEKSSSERLALIEEVLKSITNRLEKIESSRGGGDKEERAEEDKQEQEDHDEGAVKDDEDQIAALETDKKEDEKDLAYEEERSSKFVSRTAVPYQDLPKAPQDAAWSFSAEDGNELLGDDEDWAKYKRAHLWFEPDSAQSKSGYKLPIAKIYNGTLSVYFRGVQAAMAALNGARGGVDISDNDKKAIYNNIKNYYNKFNETAPPLRAEDTQNMDERIDKTVQSLNYAVRDNKESIAGSNLPEEVMTEKELQMIAEIVNRSVQAAIGPKSTEKAGSEDKKKSEMEELQQRLQKTETMLKRFIEEPTRVGQHSVGQIRAGIGATNEFSEMVTRSKSDGASNLARVVESSVDVISEENGPSTASVTDLRDLLAKGLRAAMADGLIRA